VLKTKIKCWTVRGGCGRRCNRSGVSGSGAKRDPFLELHRVDNAVGRLNPSLISEKIREFKFGGSWADGNSASASAASELLATSVVKESPARVPLH
jgi:hypothetical protein